MLDGSICPKCNMPMLVERLDGIPFCSTCEKKIRKSVAEMLATRKSRENRPKLSMKGCRYVPG